LVSLEAPIISGFLILVVSWKDWKKKSKVYSVGLELGMGASEVPIFLRVLLPASFY
jgi:hypothetical protein